MEGQKSIFIKCICAWYHVLGNTHTRRDQVVISIKNLFFSVLEQFKVIPDDYLKWILRGKLTKNKKRKKIIICRKIVLQTSWLHSLTQFLKVFRLLFVNNVQDIVFCMKTNKWAIGTIIFLTYKHKNTIETYESRIEPHLFFVLVSQFWCPMSGKYGYNVGTWWNLAPLHLLCKLSKIMCYD